MKKVAIYLFYFIIGFCIAYSIYLTIKTKGELDLKIIGLLLSFMSISFISLYFLKKKDNTFF